MPVSDIQVADNIYAVIMAGGSGTRFWPLSRKRRPKQVLSLFGHNSLLQETVHRLDGIVPRNQTLIVTNRQQYRVISPQLPELTKENFILEPSPRNTAPCIGLAAIHIHHRDPDAIMLVLPSDHLIRDVDTFQKRIKQAVELIHRTDSLVTLGIPPTRPETGYGYIQFDSASEDLPEGVYHVKTFAEKPDLSTAERFVLAGDFYWNSGIFIWRASRILAEMEEYMPEAYHQLSHIASAFGTKNLPHILRSRFSRIRPISIDYGIMEVSRGPIVMLSGDFGWSDVGSWNELYHISEKNTNGNVTLGETVSVDSKNNYIYSPDKVTAVIGLSDILVVNTPNATLICPRNRAQDVKTVVDKLHKEGRTKYL